MTNMLNVEIFEDEENKYVLYDDFIKLLEKSKELKEENKRLSKNQRYYKNGVFSLENDKETMSDMIDDYKSRIDKAIEYINDNASYSEDDKHCVDDLRYDDCDELLKILKGEEKDEN